MHFFFFHLFIIPDFDDYVGNYGSQQYFLNGFEFFESAANLN